MTDCDGDGILDHYCTDGNEQGFISLNGWCADTWPNGVCKSHLDLEPKGCHTLTERECCKYADGRKRYKNQQCVVVSNVVAPARDIGVACQPASYAACTDCEFKGEIKDHCTTTTTSPKLECTLTGGEIVDIGWSGSDTGSNSCNTCSCVSDGLICTEIGCGPEDPPAIQIHCLEENKPIETRFNISLPFEITTVVKLSAADDLNAELFRAQHEGRLTLTYSSHWFLGNHFELQVCFSADCSQPWYSRSQKLASGLMHVGDPYNVRILFDGTMLRWWVLGRLVGSVGVTSFGEDNLVFCDNGMGYSQFAGRMDEFKFTNSIESSKASESSWIQCAIFLADDIHLSDGLSDHERALSKCPSGAGYHWQVRNSANALCSENEAGFTDWMSKDIMHGFQKSLGYLTKDLWRWEYGNIIPASSVTNGEHYCKIRAVQYMSDNHGSGWMWQSLGPSWKTIWYWSGEQKCTPYTAEQCRIAANSSGLEQGGYGYEFEGVYTQKGCYAYSSGAFAGKAFFGSGGSYAEISDPNTISDDRYRPIGWNCSNQTEPSCEFEVLSKYDCPYKDSWYNRLKNCTEDDLSHNDVCKSKTSPDKRPLNLKNDGCHKPDFNVFRYVCGGDYDSFQVDREEPEPVYNRVGSYVGPVVVLVFIVGLCLLLYCTLNEEKPQKRNYAEPILIRDIDLERDGRSVVPDHDELGTSNNGLHPPNMTYVPPTAPPNYETVMQENL